MRLKRWEPVWFPPDLVSKFQRTDFLCSLFHFLRRPLGKRRVSGVQVREMLKLTLMD